MIKGHAEIILTDVNTKNEEVYHEDNIVTNVFQKLVNVNLRGMSPIKSLFPLYETKSINGILLFDEVIEENADIVLPPANVQVVAHAGASAYAGKDSGRGSFNQIESAVLSNGYKFVWDFSTSQGNGEIKSISLSSSAAGETGLGALYGEEDHTLNECLRVITSFNLEYYAAELNYSYYSTAKGNQITLRKYYNALTEFSLCSTLSNTLIKENIINLDVKNTINSSSLFLDDDGALYLLVLSANDSRFLTIDKNTLEIKKTVNLSNLLDDLLNSSYQIDFVVIEGFIYVTKNGKKFIIKIEISNTSNVKVIELEKDVCYIMKMCNRVCSSSFMLSNDIPKYFDSSSSYNTFTKGCEFNNGLIMAASYSLHQSYKNLYINNLYLATINNLASPVIKTADKTMKIIYTITEV